MRNLITGANGAAAHYVAVYLASLGETVAPIARPCCDLNDFEAVCATLDREKPDVIYHLAAKADVRASFEDGGATLKNNINSTVNLFEACRKLGQKPVMLVCSTSEVYGQPDSAPITEDFPYSPLNPYAVSKAAQDLLGRMYAIAYKFPVVVTRAFGYINPLREGIALSRFARQIAEIEAGKREVLEHGNLDSIRTFCDVRDIARAYVLAAETGGGVFNIGAEYPVSIERCLANLISMAKVPIKTRFDERLRRPTDVTRIIPDCSRFRRVTGWEPQILLRESLAWLLEHWRSQMAPKLEVVK